jgi:Helix-turn-helix domain
MVTPAEILMLARQLSATEQAALVGELLGLPPLPEWLTYAQAGDALDKSPATICRLVKRGRLKATGRGKAKRVARESVLALKVEAATRAASAVARIVGRFNCTSVSSAVPLHPNPTSHG